MARLFFSLPALLVFIAVEARPASHSRLTDAARPDANSIEAPQSLTKSIVYLQWHTVSSLATHPPALDPRQAYTEISLHPGGAPSRGGGRGAPRGGRGGFGGGDRGGRGGGRGGAWSSILGSIPSSS